MRILFFVLTIICFSRSTKAQDNQISLRVNSFYLFDRDESNENEMYLSSVFSKTNSRNIGIEFGYKGKLKKRNFQIRLGIFDSYRVTKAVATNSNTSDRRSYINENQAISLVIGLLEDFAIAKNKFFLRSGFEGIGGFKFNSMYTSDVDLRSDNQLTYTEDIKTVYPNTLQLGLGIQLGLYRQLKKLAIGINFTGYGILDKRNGKTHSKGTYTNFEFDTTNEVDAVHEVNSLTINKILRNSIELIYSF